MSQRSWILPSLYCSYSSYSFVRTRPLISASLDVTVPAVKAGSDISEQAGDRGVEALAPSALLRDKEHASGRVWGC